MAKPYQLLLGDCRTTLRQLPRRSVQCVVTSPPYWGLRDYGTAPQVWGGRRACRHRWGDATAFCRKCGAWRGSLGQEPTAELFVAHLVRVFRAVRRVLRDDGTVWLNLGDSYCGGGGFAPDAPTNVARREMLAGGIQQHGQFVLGASQHVRHTNHGIKPQGELKPKDLVGIPWLVAFALRADGWYLRADVIWHKPNPMPEAVTDRPTKAHEYLFLLTKRPHYYYDVDAIREPHTMTPQRRLVQRHSARDAVMRSDKKYHYQLRTEPGVEGNLAGRNKRSVWTITTKPFKEAHFATFPLELVTPCIKAGTSEHGCCPRCGTPWRRVTKSEYKVHKKWHGDKHLTPRHSRGKAGCSYKEVVARLTLRWAPACDCPRHVPVPCRVLDPFNGAGTTGVAAVQLRRHYVGLELNADYLQLARRRLRRACRTAAAQLPTLFEV